MFELTVIDGEGKKNVLKLSVGRWFTELGEFVPDAFMIDFNSLLKESKKTK
jgi:DNA-nicking Smr family endonuclease